MQYLLVFRLISGYTGERLIPGLRRKDWILRALLLAVTSLWPHKVGPKVEIYSARVADLRYVVELVLPENFVSSIKTLRECLV